MADFKFPVNNAERSEGSSVGSTSSPASSDPVDVKGAEVAFEKLRRTLSTASSLHRTVTGQKDAEKSVGGEEGDFDLLTYLGGDVEAKQRSGFRSKKVCGGRLDVGRPVPLLIGSFRSESCGRTCPSLEWEE